MSLSSDRRGLRAARRSPVEDSPQGLESERDFLLRSIEDLDRERSFEEVSQADFEVLQRRYRARLREVESALARVSETAPDAAGQGGPGEPIGMSRHDRAQSAPSPSWGTRRAPNRRRRMIVGVAAAVCFAVAATLLAASLAGVRLPGQSATGSISLSSAQQEQETLDRAAIVGSEGNVALAVSLYQSVLRSDPNQPDALTYGGWLERLAGLAAHSPTVVATADASIAKAVAVAPGYPDAHVFDAVVLLEDRGDARAAVAQFEAALAAHASTSLVASVAVDARVAFARAGTALPAPYATALAKR